MKKIWNTIKPIIISYILQVFVIIVFIILYLIKHNNQYELNTELYNYLIIATTVSIIPIAIYLFKKNYHKEDKLVFKKIISIIPLGIGMSLFYNMLTINFSSGDEVLMNLSLPILIIYTGIIGPIFEEILFRYVSLNKAKTFYNNKVAILLISFIFAILHTGIISILYAFILGLILSYVYIKYKNIMYPITIHIIANITSLFITEYNIYLLIIGIILLIGSFFLIKRNLK